MKTKKKIVKTRQFFELKIVPGTINILVYFVVLVICVQLGIRFNSPLQLISVIVVTIVLTWRVLFYLSQELVKLILNLKIKKQSKK